MCPRGRQDRKDGTYSATICLTRAGLATVAAAVNGAPLGRPATLPVLPGALRALALASRGQLRTTTGARLSQGGAVGLWELEAVVLAAHGSTCRSAPRAMHKIRVPCPHAGRHADTSRATGEHAAVAMAALDAHGNPLHSGGAALAATMRVFAPAGADGAPAGADGAGAGERRAEVADRGDGSYEVDCSLRQACDFEARRALAGHGRVGLG